MKKLTTLCLSLSLLITFLSAHATSFNGFDKNPATEGLNDSAIAIVQLSKAFLKSFDAIKTAHLTDYQTFFKRVHLDLGKTTAPNLPTDERLRRYREGQEDKKLEVLYFQYGRYLLISSSRTEGVSANLQGLWNPYIRQLQNRNIGIKRIYSICTRGITLRLKKTRLI